MGAEQTLIGSERSTRQQADAPSAGLLTRSGLPAAQLWRLDPAYRHLNHGSFGAVPTATLEKQAEFRAQMEANPVKWFVELPGHVARARAAVAHRLGAEPGSAALVANASAGASIVYRTLLAERRPVHVVTTDHGYGAVTMGAERLARESGGTASRVHIPLDATPEDVLGRLETHLAANRADLLVVDQVTSPTARAFPTAAICDLVHAHGVRVLVDGAHSPGVLPAAIETKADAWVGNLHKFWCAPRGTAVIAAHETAAGPALDLMPLIDSWGATLGYPERFDHQGTLDLTAWLAAPHAAEHLEHEIGWDAIRSHSAAMMDLAEREVGAALAEAGVEDPVPDVGQAVGPMRLLRLPGERTWTHDEVDALRVPFMDSTGLVVSFTEFEGRAYVRLSAHAYTTPDDIQAMASSGVPALVRGIG